MSNLINLCFISEEFLILDQISDISILLQLYLQNWEQLSAVKDFDFSMTVIKTAIKQECTESSGGLSICTPVSWLSPAQSIRQTGQGSKEAMK